LPFTRCLLVLLCLAAAPCAAADAGHDSAAERVLERVNHYRAIAGVPPLPADPQVAGAAQAHGQYMADTGQLSHGEPQRTSRHFSGDSLEERLRKAKVEAGRSAEVVGLASQAKPATIVDDLMSTVYHRLLLLSSGFARAGAGVARGEDNGVEAVYVAIDFAGPATAHAAAAGELTVYPAQDQREVPRDFDPATETPNPLPDHELVGLPVTVQSAAGTRLVVDAFRLVAEAGNSAVEAKVLIQPNDMEMPEWGAALVPLEPLAPGAAYRAEFDGTVGGSPVQRRWRFTTAATQTVVMSFAQAVVPAGGMQTVRLRNLDEAGGTFYLCYDPVQLVRAVTQETPARFTISVNRCAPGAACTVTVLAGRDERCSQPFARGSFRVGG
jgi:uncharacterized protein YkwD